MELRELSKIDDPLLQKIGRLRVEAWQTKTSRAAEMETWIDEFDLTARHWVVFQNGLPVAAARLSVHEALEDIPDAESYLGVFRKNPPALIASLNRLVVAPCARGLGLSKRLDVARLRAAEQMGCRSAVLSTASGSGRVKQLVGWGFAVAGEGPRFKNPPLCHLGAPVVLSREIGLAWKLNCKPVSRF
ncbi:MAG: hypothetical protein QOD99_1890 [Chthoniobacter sp.]|jgi:GNAT superfamily N-acetyltransferase|nr:hypothetical protein [Chthoniobacter sp.]